MNIELNYLAVTSLLIFSNVIVNVNGNRKTRQICASFGNTPGECISIKNCPTFIKLLKTGQLTTKKLETILKLSCGFDGSNPKICCPISSIQRNFELTFPAINSQRIKRKNRTEEVTLKKEINPNVSLLPDLEYCSLSRVGDRIVGGKKAKFGSVPWIARIGYKDLRTNSIVYACGGTIISKRYILTAAHCLSDIGRTFIPHNVRLGEYDSATYLDCEKEKDDYRCTRIMDIPIQKIITHQNYSPSDKVNDVALIRLSYDIEFHADLQPVCLPLKHFCLNFTNDLVEQEAKVSGWGKQKWKNNETVESSVLQEVNLKIIRNEKCKKDYSLRTKLTIVDSQICCLGDYGKDSCDGDSGGPLTYHHKEGKISKAFLIGVVSYGPNQCGTMVLPGVYSRVSSYLDWILNTIQP